MYASNDQRRQSSDRRRRSVSASRVAATAVDTSVASVATVKSTRQTQLPFARRLAAPQPTTVATNAKGDSSRHATLQRNHHGAQTEAPEPLRTSVATARLYRLVAAKRMRESWRHGEQTSPVPSQQIASRPMATMRRRFYQLCGRFNRLLAGRNGLKSP